MVFCDFKPSPGGFIFLLQVIVFFSINQLNFTIMTMYFTNCKSFEDIEKAYKEIYEMFDLDRQPADHFIRKEVDEQYKAMSQFYANKEQPGSEAENELTLDDVLAKIKGLNCEAEICGKWLWVRGKSTYNRFNDLKEIGFRYSKNKKSFYWRPADAKSSNPEPMPMEYIREKYGSNEVALR